MPLAVWDGIGTSTDVRSFGGIDGQTGNFVGDGGTVGTVIRQGGGRVLVSISQGYVNWERRKLPCGACFAHDFHARQHQLRQQPLLQQQRSQHRDGTYRASARL